MNYLDKILLLMILLLVRKKLFGICIPKTPCPNIFSYKYLEYGELKILVPNRKAEIIHLEVSYYSRATLENVNIQNSLQVYNSKEEVAANIANGRPVTFVLKYPFPNDPPRIDKITLDGNVICTGEYDYSAVLIAKVDKFVHVQKIIIQVPVRNSLKQPPEPQYTSQQLTQDLVDRNQRKPSQKQEQRVFLPNDPNCGTETNDPVAMQLVVNGVSGEKLPWLAALFDNDKDGPKFFCAASLISARFVVTAAHCVVSKTNVLIKIGGSDVTSFFTQDGGKMRISAKIKPHPNYEPLSSNADIALIKMTEAVMFDNNIKPVCMWPNKYLEESVIVGQNAIIYGWGNDENGRLSADTLKKTKLRIKSYEECKKMNLLANVISDKTICAKGSDAVSGPCLGDSGGGLYMQVLNKWTIRGVISTAIGMETSHTCDVQNFFSVYTDTAKYFDWILNSIETM